MEEEDGLSRKRRRFSDGGSSSCVIGEAEILAAEAVAKSVKKKRKQWTGEGLHPLTGKKFSDRYRDLLVSRSKLPAWDCRKNLLKLVKKNQCVLVIGETGSGKTTQCSQFLVEAEYGRGLCIACTQPRRVAAMSVARRVAQEMDVELGKQVGYRIRFDDVSTPGVTVLKYCTDGSLLREAQSDPSLTKYGIIILDEAHERTLDTDILFGLLKNIMPLRKDLKVIVMSATLDAEGFQKYFNNAPVLRIPGRMHPVEILYTPKPEPSFFNAALRTVLQIHATEPPGDILLFMTGEEDIDQMKKALEKDAARLTREHGELLILPLHSSLPPAAQERVFDSAPGPLSPNGPPGRKVIVATNVAETSITIDGVVYVIDPGFSKQKVYNPRTRVESLLISPISKASAQQRAGRAGRTRPGKCFRLYTEQSFQRDLPDRSYPEIQRSNLASVVLTLLKLGVQDLVHFDFMEPPAAETLMRALEQLNYLNALNEEGQLTPSGELMSEFPLEPQLSAMVVNSYKYSCVPEIIILAALLSVPPVFLRPRDQASESDAAKLKFCNSRGDHLTLLNVFQAFKESMPQDKEFCYEYWLHHRSLTNAERIRDQLTRIYTRLDLKVSSIENDDRAQKTAVCRGILSGFFLQIAFHQKGLVYQTVPDLQGVALHPSSVMTHSPEWVIYHEVVLTTKNYIRTVTEFDGDWLPEIAPRFWADILKNAPQGELRQKIIAIESRRRLKGAV